MPIVNIQILDTNDVKPTGPHKVRFFVKDDDGNYHFVKWVWTDATGKKEGIELNIHNYYVKLDWPKKCWDITNPHGLNATPQMVDWIIRTNPPCLERSTVLTAKIADGGVHTVDFFLMDDDGNYIFIQSVESDEAGSLELELPDGTYHIMVDGEWAEETVVPDVIVAAIQDGIIEIPG